MNSIYIRTPLIKSSLIFVFFAELVSHDEEFLFLYIDYPSSRCQSATPHLCHVAKKIKINKDFHVPVHSIVMQHSFTLFLALFGVVSGKVLFRLLLLLLLSTSIRR